jgi:two-component system alkaline phosphatase synthesis response regulator PhoP
MGTIQQKILIVDDEPDIRDILSHCLKKVGYSVYTACHGRDGINAALEYRPHLIVLDVMMPVLNGLEACKILRSMPEFKTTFIAFLTARNDDQTEIDGFTSGADDYIQKPMKPQVFVNRIQAILRRKDSAIEKENIPV